MKEANTNLSEVSSPEVEQKEGSTKLLLVMCIQIVLISSLLVMGLSNFIILSFGELAYDNPLFYIILYVITLSLLVAAIVFMYLATPKGSRLRRNFRVFIIVSTCLAILFSLLSLAAAYAMKHLLSGIKSWR